LTNHTAAVSDDWDRHWEHYAETVESNPAQAYRRRITFEMLAEAGAPQRLLDIGSGQGDLLRDAAQRWPEAELLGIELSAAGVAEGERKIPAATFLQRNLLTDKSAPGRYQRWATHAVCSEVLEHVDDPAALLLGARSFLSPRCRLVVTVPGGPRSAFDKYIGHRRHYTPAALRDVLVASGFSVDAVRAAGFPVFNLYKLLVIARGRRLIEDLRRSGDAPDSRLAEAVMRCFTPMFALALPNTRWGWQLVAVAKAR
jgi:SAM-dependent methyltransferase